MRHRATEILINRVLLVVGILAGMLAIASGVRSYLLRNFLNFHRTHPLASIAVDLAKSNRYTLPFEHTNRFRPSVFNVTLELDPPWQLPRMSFAEYSPDGAMRIRNAKNEEVWSFPFGLSSPLSDAVTNQLPPHWDFYIGRLPKGRYDLEIDITNGSPILKPYRQKLILTYNLKDQTVDFDTMIMLAGLFLVLSALSLAISLQKWRL